MFSRNAAGGRDRGNDRIDRVPAGGRNDRSLDRGPDRGRGDDRRDVGGSNFRDNSRNGRDSRNIDNRASDRQGGRQNLGGRDAGRSDFRADRDQVLMSRDHRGGFY